MFRGDGIVTALDSGLAVNEILKITSNIKIFPTENTSCAYSLLSLFKVQALLLNSSFSKNRTWVLVHKFTGCLWEAAKKSFSLNG